MSVAAAAGRAVLAVLLMILAAALLLLLALLLCPVRYELRFAAEDPEQEKEENVFLALFDTAAHSRKTARLRFSWFFRLVKGELSYPEDPQLVLTIFGKKWRPSEKTAEEEWQPSPDNEAQAELDRLRAQREGSGKQEDVGKEADKYCKEDRKPENQRQAVERLQSGIQDLLNSVRRLFRKTEDIPVFLSAHSTQKALRRLTRLLKMLLNRYLPEKWEIRGKVGLGDPSWTGKMLEGIGYSYPLTAGHMYIEPEFTGVYCDVRGSAEGKIRLIFLAAAVVRAALDKNVRICWRQIRSR